MAATAGQYQVRELETRDEARWDAFVRSCDSGTFFHLSGWKHVIENALHHPTTFLLCEFDSEIVGVLPLAHVKSVLFDNALISLPFLVYGGVVATDSRAEQLLVEAACRHAEDLGVDYLELRNSEDSGRAWPRNAIYATFKKKLDPDPNENLLAVPRKQRAMIRKGIEAGLEADLDPGTSRLHEAMLVCKRNLGTPFFGQGYLKAIRSVFGDAVEVITVTKNRKTICSVMSFRFRNQILPYYGGGGDAARVFKGNDFMYWAVMERACREGVEVFDYGRSRIGTGAYRFKKHWGFEPEPLAYEYFLVGNDAVPDLNPANPKFGFVIDAWKRLPLGVAKVLGPAIARRLS